MTPTVQLSAIGSGDITRTKKPYKWKIAYTVDTNNAALQAEDGNQSKDNWSQALSDEATPIELMVHKLPMLQS